MLSKFSHIMDEADEQRRVRNWLVKILEERQMKPTALAKMSGLAPSTINRFLKSPAFTSTISSKTVMKICDALGIEDPFNGLGGKKDLPTRVPVISWIQAGTMRATEDPYPLGQADKWVAVDSNKDTLLANEIRGTSINRRADEGDIVVWDFADRDLVDKKFYVIRIGDEATVKRYRATPARFEPFSLDPDHPTIFLGPGVEILGRVIRFISYA